MYNDVRNSQEVETMFLLESKENIGKYLKKLIKERGFEKDADFSRAYLKEKYRNIDYTEDDLNIKSIPVRFNACISTIIVQFIVLF